MTDHDALRTAARAARPHAAQLARTLIESGAPRAEIVRQVATLLDALSPLDVVPVHGATLEAVTDLLLWPLVAEILVAAAAERKASTTDVPALISATRQPARRLAMQMLDGGASRDATIAAVVVLLDAASVLRPESVLERALDALLPMIAASVVDASARLLARAKGPRA